MFKFKDFSGRALLTVASLVECAGDDTGPRSPWRATAPRAPCLLFGTCFQAKSSHEVKDLFVDDSSPKCRNAGAYLSTFESPCPAQPNLRPDDIAPGGTAAARPGVGHDAGLDFFAAGAKPRTAGDRRRPAGAHPQRQREGPWRDGRADPRRSERTWRTKLPFLEPGPNNYPETNRRAEELREGHHERRARKGEEGRNTNKH